jgi:hypothetical protein
MPQDSWWEYTTVEASTDGAQVRVLDDGRELLAQVTDDWEPFAVTLEQVTRHVPYKTDASVPGGYTGGDFVEQARIIHLRRRRSP